MNYNGDGYLKRQILDSILSGDESKFFELLPDSEICWSDFLIKKSNDTPAHFAAMTGSVNMLRYFFQNGCENFFHHKNFEGKTPLHIAAQYGSIECVQFLISCKVDVDALKRSDWTPLMLACTKRKLEVVQELVTAGANIRLKNKDGWTAFHIAVREGCVEIIDYLLSVDPSIWDSKSNNGRTPLHTAALHGHLQVVCRLIRSGCDKNAQDKCGITCTMDAVSGDHFSLLKYLVLDAKVDVDRRDAIGRSVLHFAAHSGSCESIAFLVSNRYIDVNQQTHDGFTALHFALKGKQIQCYELLLQLEAKDFPKDQLI